MCQLYCNFIQLLNNCISRIFWRMMLVCLFMMHVCHCSIKVPSLYLYVCMYEL